MKSGLLYASVIAAGYFLRFRTLYLRAWWTDEIEQIRSLHAYSFRAMVFQYMRTIPGGFPGDYIVTWPMSQVTNNKWWMATPHIFASLLTFSLFLKICVRERLSSFATLLGLCCLAFNRNLIFHDFEIRPYAMLPALALANYLLFDLRVKRPDWKPIDYVGWGVWVSGVVLFHAYGFLIVGCLLLYQTFTIDRTSEKRQSIQRLWIATLGAFMLVFPLWRFFARAPGLLRNTFAYVPKSIPRVVAFFIGNLGDLGFRFSWVLSLAVISFACLLISVKHWRDQIGFLLILLAAPLSFIFISDYICSYWFVPRQFTWAMPFWALAVSQSVNRISIWRRIQPKTAGSDA